MRELDRPTKEQYRAAVEMAHDKLSELCKGKRFEMTIPVQSTDTDIVIGNGLFVANTLLKECDALTARAVTAEARVAQLERAIANDPLEANRLRSAIDEALHTASQFAETGASAADLLPYLRADLMES